MTKNRSPSSVKVQKYPKTSKSSSAKRKSVLMPKGSVLKKTSRKPEAAPAAAMTEEAKELLNLAQMWSEKCELAQAREVYGKAKAVAEKAGDHRSLMEAISGQLRIAGESLDESGIERLEDVLDGLMAKFSFKVPPMAWYCKATIARYRENWILSQRYFHRYLNAVRREAKANDRENPEGIARAWANLASCLRQRGHLERSKWLAEAILRRYENHSFRGINGTLYLILGRIAEARRDLKTAVEWYQKAYVSYLGEHNWYLHLYVLYAFARIARMQQSYVQAYWYLDLIEKAAAGPEFNVLKRQISRERTKLEQDAVDLLIDSRKAVVKTREAGSISLRKQYVLLHILEALSSAHERQGEDRERGLTKAEIIERVWGEKYRPEAHDNKLYYNINRLRKLIEPDVRQPQYLLNSKDGYRLAPGLRIQYVGGRTLPGAQVGLSIEGGGERQ